MKSSTHVAAISHAQASRFLWGSGLVVAVLLTYAPVWRAGFVWDDRAVLTANPCIVGPLGLRQLWTTHFADICPLTLSALWLEHRCWDLSPLPYHLVNVLLHAASAVVLWQVLRGLRVPGAWLGAVLWALHPVQAESVAWVTEQKNTLSGLCFLASILCFLRWLDLSPPGGSGVAHAPPIAGFWYGLSLLCAALAMAAKSSTVVLPVVLWLCVWWREGGVRRDRLVRLVPWFLLAAAAGALSLWTQGLALADDARWARPWPDRLVAAGEATWFYLGKLLWPHPLAAVYPRWQVHVGQPWEWLPSLLVAAGAALLWRWRGSPWGRACLFAYAFFLVALLPALGLLDNTIFRFSLVFDHFQYLASMGPLALAGAGGARLVGGALPGSDGWRRTLGAGVLLILGALSWQHANIYRDEETFWSDTLAKNPRCWIGHGNLGSALLLAGQTDAARAHYEAALAINPDYAEAHGNLGVIFLRQGKLAEAVGQLERAVALQPHDVEAHSNLGNAFLAGGQVDPAIAQYQAALEIDPEYYVVYFNLGNAQYSKGLVDQAIASYEKALSLHPDDAGTHGNLGNALLAKRQPDEAIAEYERALAIRPDFAEAHHNLGIALMRTARFGEAVVQFQITLQLAPDFPNVRNDLAAARALAQRSKSQP